MGKPASPLELEKRQLGHSCEAKHRRVHCYCLPDIDFDDDKFVKENDGEQTWSRKAHQFASRFVASIVALDKALRTTAEVTPEPPWASDPQYVLGLEMTLRVQLLEAERKVEHAQ